MDSGSLNQTVQCLHSLIRVSTFAYAVERVFFFYISNTYVKNSALTELCVLKLISRENEMEDNYKSTTDPDAARALLNDTEVVSETRNVQHGFRSIILERPAFRKVVRFVRENLLLLTTICGVILGFGLGFLLRQCKLTDQGLMWLGMYCSFSYIHTSQYKRLPL